MDLPFPRSDDTKESLAARPEEVDMSLRVLVCSTNKARETRTPGSESLDRAVAAN